MIGRLFARHSMKHVNLKEDEIVRLTVRRHPFAVAIPLAVGIIIFLVPFFLMVPLFRLKAVGLIIGAVFLLFGAFVALRSWLLWRSNVFLVTNRRIIDVERKGFFDWVVSEASYHNIEDISYRTTGMLQNLLGVGDVVVQTASGFVNLVLQFVKNPGGVRDAINDERETARRTV